MTASSSAMEMESRAIETFGVGKRGGSWQEKGLSPRQGVTAGRMQLQLGLPEKCTVKIS